MTTIKNVTRNTWGETVGTAYDKQAGVERSVKWTYSTSMWFWNDANGERGYIFDAKREREK